MKKRNMIVLMLFSILFVGSIYLYFINSNKIKDNRGKTDSLKLQLESLKAENQTLIKANSQLNQTNSSISEKVNKLKSITH